MLEQQQASKTGTKVQLHLPRKEGKKLLTLKVLERKKEQKSVTLDHEPVPKELKAPEQPYADMTAKEFYEAKRA